MPKGSKQKIKSSLSGDLSGMGASSLVKGLGALAVQTSLSDYDSLDPQLVLVLKKLNKRDEKTKLKAMEELDSLISSMEDIESLKVLMPHFAGTYEVLSIDVDKRVRLLCNQVLQRIAQRLKKEMAPYLKQLIGVWMNSWFDNNNDVARLSNGSFNELFPEDKRAAVMSFCAESIMLFCSDMILIKQPDTLSDPRFVTKEDMESKFSRVLSGALQSLCYLIENLSDKTLIEGKLSIILSSESIWSLFSGQDSFVKKSLYAFMVCVGQNYKDLFSQHKAKLKSCFVTKCFAEKDPSIYSDLWNLLLICLHHYDIWPDSNELPRFWKSLFSFLSAGCYGAVSVSYETISVFLALIKEARFKDETEFCNFNQQFMDNLWKGLFQGHLLQPKFSSKLIQCYFDCLKIISFQSNQKDEIVLGILEKPVHDYLLTERNKLLNERIDPKKFREYLSGFLKKSCSEKPILASSFVIFLINELDFIKDFRNEGISHYCDIIETLEDPRKTKLLDDLKIYIENTINSNEDTQLVSCLLELAKQLLSRTLLSAISFDRHRVQNLFVGSGDSLASMFEVIILSGDELSAKDIPSDNSIMMQYLKASVSCRKPIDLSSINLDLNSSFEILEMICSNGSLTEFDGILNSIFALFSSVLLKNAEVVLLQKIFTAVSDLLNRNDQKDKLRELDYLLYTMISSMTAVAFEDNETRDSIESFIISNGKMSRLVGIHAEHLRRCSEKGFDKKTMLVTEHLLKLFPEGFWTLLERSYSSKSEDWEEKKTLVEYSLIDDSLLSPLLEESLNHDQELQNVSYFVNYLKEHEFAIDAKQEGFIDGASYLFRRMQLCIDFFSLNDYSKYTASLEAMKSFVDVLRSRIGLLGTETERTVSFEDYLQENTWTTLIVRKLLSLGFEKAAFYAFRFLGISERVCFASSSKLDNISLKWQRFYLNFVKDSLSLCEMFLDDPMNLVLLFKPGGMEKTAVDCYEDLLENSSVHEVTCFQEIYTIAKGYLLQLQNSEECDIPKAIVVQLIPYLLVLGGMQQDDYMFICEIVSSLILSPKDDCVQFLAYQVALGLLQLSASVYIPTKFKEIIKEALLNKIASKLYQNFVNLSVRGFKGLVSVRFHSISAECLKFVPVELINLQWSYQEILNVMRISSPSAIMSGFILLDKLTRELVIALSTALELVGSDSVVDEDSAKLPESLISFLSTAPSAYPAGEKEGFLAILTQTMILLDFFEYSSFKLKQQYFTCGGMIEIFTEVLLIVVKILNIGTNIGRPFNLDKWDIEVFDFENFDYDSPVALQLLAAKVFYRMIRHLPSLLREIYGSIRDRQISLAIASYVEAYYSPALIKDEVSVVSDIQGKSDDTFSVRTLFSTASCEIIGKYKIEDVEPELKIRIPKDYPLRQVEIEGSKRVGVTEDKWKRWILNCFAVLNSQNGTLLECLNVWKQNVTKHFDGVEECAICYCVVGSYDRTLPSKQCKTCKNKFHSACLFKWFKSSSNSTCPLCRSIF